MLDPNGLPVDLLSAPAVVRYVSAHRSGGPATREVTADDVRHALAGLARLSLVATSESAVARIHALLQRAALEHAPPDDVAAAVSAAADGLLQVWPAVEQDLTYSQLLRANAEAIRRRAEDHVWLTSPELLLRSARSLGDTGLASAALVQFGHLAAKATARLGRDHPHTLVARGGLAYWRMRTGNFAQALADAEELLADRVRVLGPEHSETLAARNMIASLQHVMGESAVTPENFDALLADRIRYLGPDHPDTLTMRAARAQLWAERGEVAQALAQITAVAADMARVLGPRHEFTLVASGLKNVLAGLHGGPTVTVTSLEALLAELTAALGADHPQVLVGRGHLALWLAHAGDRNAATAALDSLAADLARVLGREHPLVAIVRRHQSAIAAGTVLTSTPGDPCSVSLSAVPSYTGRSTA